MLRDQTIQQNSVAAACQALDLTKKLGVTAEVDVCLEAGFSVNVRGGDVETLEHHRGKGLSVTIYHNQHVGAASTADLTSNAITETVNKAHAIAKYTDVDRYAGLVDPQYLARNYPNLNLAHEWKITPAEAIQWGIEGEKIILAHDERITQVEGVSIDTVEHWNVYGNSHGFLGSYLSTRHSISCQVVARENGMLQRDGDYTVARHPKQLDEMTLVAQRAAQRAVHRLGAKKIPTMICPVIFEAPVAKSIIGHFIGAISGRRLYTKSSFLIDHLGRALFPKHIHIKQSPHLLGALGSAPFDHEGVKTVEQFYVQSGELVNYVLDGYSARKLAMVTTGNAGGVFNLSIDHSSMSLRDLCKTMGRGLLVTELLGQGVNLVTGDYSRAAAGYWVENGEIQHAVEGITIAGHLKDMFSKLLHVANDVDCRGSIQTGSLLIEQMTIAG